MNFQTWLGIDKNLKLDFLDHELKLNRLITLGSQTNHNGIVIENFITEVHLSSGITESSRIDDFRNMGPVSVHLSEQTFDELKKIFGFLNLIVKIPRIIELKNRSIWIKIYLITLRN